MRDMNDRNVKRFDNGNGGNNGGRGNGPGGNGPGGNGGNQTPRWPNILMSVLSLISMIICVYLIMGLFFGNSEPETPYTQFLQDLEDGKVESVQVNAEQAQILVSLKKEEKAETKEEPAGTFYDIWKDMRAAMQTTGGQYNTRMMETLDTLTERLETHNVTAVRIVKSGLGLEFWIGVIAPIVLFAGLMIFMFRKMGGSGGPMGVGKSNAKVYVQKETGVTFKDVAGEDEAKESLVEVVDFLHNPGKYSKIGAKLPKGALLVGPPGTGKTLLARAVAGEAHVPFFSLTGSDFIELYVGVGASRVRDLFKEAAKNAPCIVFIDEIDAIGRSRDSKYGGGNEEREQTLNQLLAEMDGFDTSKGILILAATNRPEILDKALLRPGRFDRRIIVDKPDLKGRVEILKVHSKDVKMDETVDLDAIALATSGAVGSDLANMINEAAINAVKEGRECVNQHDLFNAVEQVLVGKEKKDRIMSKEERKIVSYHEVGHALISALQKNSEPVQKITIVPRTMGALGYVMHVPEEEKYLNTEAELRDMLVSLVGGRAAEEVVFDTVTTGAANDIERATEIARSMVTRYGMSKKFGLVGLATVESQYLDGRASLNCSDKTAAEIDAEVVAIIKESYDKALEMLGENREVMDKLAAFLIEKETITGKEFMQIYRKEKGIPEPVEEKAEDGKTVEDKDGTDGGNGEKEDAADNSGSTETAGNVEDAANPEPADKPEAGGSSERSDRAENAGDSETADKTEALPDTETDNRAENDDKPQEHDPDHPVGLFSRSTID